MNREDDIKQILKERNIKLLFHFTRLSNLENILDKGLKTLDKLKKGVNVYCNDQYRYDKTNAICLSISFPNYKMFYRVRLDNPNETWVVLVLDSNILHELDCSFFYENAASGVFSGQTYSEEYKSVTALENMFEDYSPNIFFGEKITRESLRINENYPTNPQAEVLVHEDISIDYFIDIICDNEATSAIINELNKDIKVTVIPKAFSYRDDYLHW